ncbi:MAG: LON peptidase substrate-binding domain-containing protein, partial [Pseudomonadota bacterium]
MTTTKTLPVLPLRDIVVFPDMVAPLFVGRDKSVRALEMVEEGRNEIMLVAQTDPATDDPAQKDVHEIGTTATILQLLKLPDGTVKVLVEGSSRAKIKTFIDQGDHYLAEVETMSVIDAEGGEIEALLRAVIEQFENYAKLNRKIPPESVSTIGELTDPGMLADAVAAQLQVKLGDKQALLEMPDAKARLEKILSLMESELGMMQMERKIKNRVKRQMEKSQREYYLNEQMKAIQRELGGEGDEGERDEVAELEAKIKETGLSEEARTKADAEVKKLRQMSPMSAESTVVRNYLDWLL